MFDESGESVVLVEWFQFAVLEGGLDLGGEHWGQLGGVHGCPTMIFKSIMQL